MESQAQERVNLFIPVIIIIFVVSIVIVFNYIKGENPVEYSVNEDSMKEIPELTLAEIEQKLSECVSGRTVQQQDWCNLNLARNYAINSCSVIVNQDSKKYCEAIIEKDVQKCDQVLANSIQDACYITLATMVKDPSVCRRSQREDFCMSLFQ